MKELGIALIYLLIFDHICDCSIVVCTSSFKEKNITDSILLFYQLLVGYDIRSMYSSMCIVDTIPYIAASAETDGEFNRILCVLDAWDKMYNIEPLFRAIEGTILCLIFFRMRIIFRGYSINFVPTIVILLLTLSQYTSYLILHICTLNYC